MIQSTSRGGPEYPEGQLLYRGAEADLLRGSWQGLDAVFKVRKPLSYRHPTLDRTIRHQRTLREAEMIHSVKRAGVPAPRLYYVDLSAATLAMEYVQGDRVKELVGRVSPEETSGIFRHLGRDTARLHSSGIMHGDLTTANVIRRDGELVFLDFGLSLHSTRTEDHAVDLRLIKETIVGAHSAFATLALQSLLDGYSAEAGEERSRGVLKQLRNIELRGRYARVA